MSLVTRGKIIKERPIQTKAFDEVTKLLQTRGECLVKMFCGTGKSRVIKRVILEHNYPLSVVVFPSLALIRQFTKDYLGDIDGKLYGLLNVSSEELAHITSTTDTAQIQHFLNNPKTKHQQKIICVTYQSLAVLLHSIGDTKIGMTCFDEAHHTTSDSCKKLVYGDNYRSKYEKRVFFTATPVNANGITMFDRERNEMGTYGDCGPLACEYTYLQGLRDAILSLFELRIDLYTQDTTTNIYESIARAILTTGNTRVLTFHADAAAESDSETSVLRFVDKAKFVDAFCSVCAKEFPDKVGMFADERITFRAITADTKDKDAILGAFDTCTDDEIYIVSSCRTIGEGVDTKNANMCVFVDPKSSPKDIIQNIGRICRKIAGSERQPATVLIPVCIGWEKYREAGDDPEVQDKLIREQMNDLENGDYNAIMNVCAALKQEDPELYELCLKYPSNFTESERKHALEEQGFRVLEEDDDACEDADLEPNVLYPEDIDELVENGDRVEIHTSNVDVPIVYRGFDDEACEEDEEEEERPIQRFYEVEEENEEGEMETRYHRIAPVNGEEEDEEDSNRRLNPPKTTNRPRMNIHTNDEIKLLWRMGDVVLGEQFGSGVLECQVERLDNDELWKENHMKMCEFIDENGRVPRQSGAKVDPDEKRLAVWVATQKNNYNPSGSEFSKQRMKNPEIWKMWKDTINDPIYNQHLVVDYAQNWMNHHTTICEFIEKNGRAPRSSGTIDDYEEKRLGCWLTTQKINYDPRGYKLSKQRMKDEDIWVKWSETLSDPRYKKYLVIDRVHDWMNNHQTMCEFIDKTGKRPSEKSKDFEEKRVGYWTCTQKIIYDPRSPKFSKQIMKNEKAWTKWTETLADPKYNKYLVIDQVQDWFNYHATMCAFINKNGKTPSSSANDSLEQIVANWIGAQKAKYCPSGAKFSKYGMKNEDIWEKWTETLADPIYNKYLIIDQVQNWVNYHTKMCEFIDMSGKMPSEEAKNHEEKRLARWIGAQKKKYNPMGAEFSKEGMKNEDIWMKWTDTIADPKYNKHLVIDREQDWINNLANVCTFIDNNGKAPSEIARDLEVQKLGRWIGAQKNHYDTRGPDFSKKGMKNEYVWTKWTEILAVPKYGSVLADFIEMWKNHHRHMCAFIEKNGKSPSSSSKDVEIRTLGLWVSRQKQRYNASGPHHSDRIMKKSEIWQIWTDTLADDKYNEALADSTQSWKNKYNKMCAFIDKNEKAPSSSSKYPEEKILGKWVGGQKKNYNPDSAEFSKEGMKNAEIWQIWTETLEKYNKYLTLDPVQNWKNNREKMCLQIDKTGKVPSSIAKDPEEKRLGSWVSNQKHNYDPRGPEFSKEGMKTPEIWQIWTETIQKYPCLKKQGQETPCPPPSPPIQEKPKLKLKVTSNKSHLIPNPSLECSAPETNPNTTPKRVITDSPYKLTGRAWATQKSTTTHEKLQSNPAEWHAYHAARDISFQGYTDQSQIPRNRIIAHLANKRKDKKFRILDLGCGRNNIAQHFMHIEKDHKFTVQGYDHVIEEGSTARVGNIANLVAQEEDESVDICIYSQSLMGTDWCDYLTEGYRMLRCGGEFIISEHIKMLDNVRAELVRLGCKIESVDADAVEVEAHDDKVPKWFVLVARVG
jgi:superfamily II DNA or RNA helicase